MTIPNYAKMKKEELVNMLVGLHEAYFNSLYYDDHIYNLVNNMAVDRANTNKIYSENFEKLNQLEAAIDTVLSNAGVNWRRDKFEQIRELAEMVKENANLKNIIIDQLRELRSKK